jgi:hypothetical protein
MVKGQAFARPAIYATIVVADVDSNSPLVAYPVHSMSVSGHTYFPFPSDSDAGYMHKLTAAGAVLVLFRVPVKQEVFAHRAVLGNPGVVVLLVATIEWALSHPCHS